MHASLATTMISLALFAQPIWAAESTPLEVLERYAAGQERLESWSLLYESIQKSEDPCRVEGVDTRFGESDMRVDGTRAYWRWHKWGGIEGSKSFLPREKAKYLSMMWDGEVFSNYRTGWKDPNGILTMDPKPHPDEIDALRYRHLAGPLFGYYLNTNKRVDAILREAQALSLRDEAEDVNGVLCHVIEAQSVYGDYTVWIDPTRGYSIAKIEIEIRVAANHLFLGNPAQADGSIALRVHSFEKVEDTWIPTDVAWDTMWLLPDGRRLKGMNRVTVKSIVLNPDHDLEKSFVRNDVKDGAKGWSAPDTHIKRKWCHGEFVPIYEKEIIQQIDRVLQNMTGHARGGESSVDVNGPTVREGAVEAHPLDSTDIESVRGAIDTSMDTKAAVSELRRTRPFCGLYCVYAILALTGHGIDFPEMIKPEYFGSSQGSSILELRRAAIDYGLNAEPAGGLSVSTLCNCPYRAILHVRSHPESPRYDHYELFLGVDKGKAKLFDPPETPRLVSFLDLATRWDGKALLLSEVPIDVDSVLSVDRQRLLWYAAGVIVLLVCANVAKRIWLCVVPTIPRKWVLCLSGCQAAMIGLASLLVGGIYHFVARGGLLTNAVATQSLQRGYAASFIPKVSQPKVGAQLGTETVFIDARLKADYTHGHLDGAISLPIDANEAIWKATTAGIPQDAHIVTYCQSAACTFAQRVSLRLIEDGYSDVSIFKGGWAEWIEKDTRRQTPMKQGKEAETKDGKEHDPAQ